MFLNKVFYTEKYQKGSKDEAKSTPLEASVFSG